MEDKIVYGGMFNLTSSNYQTWKTRMEHMKDLHEPILNANRPSGKDEAAWKLLNRKVVGLIQKFTNQSVFHHVSCDTNAYTLWNRL